MATEITEEVVLARVKEKAYFSEEEFPLVPKLLAGLVQTGKLTATEVLEFAVVQAESLDKNEVFLVVLTALKRVVKCFWNKRFEAGKPYAIIAGVTSRMLPVILGGGPETSTFADYKKVCGL
jgi:hypothetical protein